MGIESFGMLNNLIPNGMLVEQQQLFNLLTSVVIKLNKHHF